MCVVWSGVCFVCGSFVWSVWCVCFVVCVVWCVCCVVCVECVCSVRIV